MSQCNLAAPTPHYVLIAGDQRIGPPVALWDASEDCLAIYGFSDRAAYDAFCSHGQASLRPYPLVKNYLKNQLDSFGDRLQLVVIDAASPSESPLRAATVKAVLDSHASRDPHVSAAYRLTFDHELNAYRAAAQTPA